MTERIRGERAKPIDVQWIDARLAVLKLSRTGLARKLGIAKSMMTRSMVGTRTFTLADAVEMARIFGVTVDEIGAGAWPCRGREGN